MHSSIEFIKESFLEIGERKLQLIYLPPLSTIADYISIDRDEENDYVYIVIVSTGILSSISNSISIKKSQVLSITNPGSLQSGIHGANVLLVKIPNKAIYTDDTFSITKIPKLKYFDKYNAKICKIDIELGIIRAIQPWSLYFVKVNFTNTILLHLHKHLRNILFFLGEKNVELGYLIIEKDDTPYALPIVGGDLVVVDKSVIHNVCAKNETQLSFFVFNDEESNYQIPSTSDYHNLYEVDSENFTLLKRTTITPSIIKSNL